jgi:hypothetical protein
MTHQKMVMEMAAMEMKNLHHRHPKILPKRIVLI